MQRTTIIKPRIFKRKDLFFSFVAKNNGLLIIYLFLIIGLAFGSLSNKWNYSANQTFFTEYLFLRQNKTFLSVFLSAFLELLPFIAICFFAGTCMAGSLIVPVVVLYRGYLIGSLIGYLYLSKGLYGIVFNVILVIPAVTVSLIALVLMAREAFLFSLCLAKLVFPGKLPEKSLYQDFMIYCKRQLIIFILFVISALIDAVFSIGFISFFNF